MPKIINMKEGTLKKYISSEGFAKNWTRWQSVEGNIHKRLFKSIKKRDYLPTMKSSYPRKSCVSDHKCVSVMYIPCYIGIEEMLSSRKEIF